MIVIEQSEAQARLHDMWRAVLTDGEVAFAEQGRVTAKMVWKGSPETRDQLIEELSETIGFRLTPPS